MEVLKYFIGINLKDNLKEKKATQQTTLTESVVSLNQKLYSFENGSQNVLTFIKCFAPLKYAMFFREFSNSFDSLLLAKQIRWT